LPWKGRLKIGKFMVAAAARGGMQAFRVLLSYLFYSWNGKGDLVGVAGLEGDKAWV
jgi:hypothetical protein